MDWLVQPAAQDQHHTWAHQASENASYSTYRKWSAAKPLSEPLKRFICEVCDKGFMQVRDLEYHSNSHTGKKPYKCGICHKGFSDRRNMKRHEKVMHRQPAENRTESSPNEHRFPTLSVLEDIVAQQQQQQQQQQQRGKPTGN